MCELHSRLSCCRSFATPSPFFRVRTDGRLYRYLTINFSGLMGYQNVSPRVLRWHASGARAPLRKNMINNQQSNFVFLHFTQLTAPPERPSNKRVCVLWFHSKVPVQVLQNLQHNSRSWWIICNHLSGLIERRLWSNRCTKDKYLTIFIPSKLW